MTDCRAAVIIAHNKPLEIQNVKVPELDTGSMLVKIVTSTLCGTDVHRWHGPLPKGDSLPATSPAALSRKRRVPRPTSSASP